MAKGRPMTYEEKERLSKIIILIAVPLAALMLWLFQRPIISLAALVGTCQFHEITGLNCPGCGNTRSVRCLLHGDILLALRMNITVPFLLFLGGLYYIEIIFDLCGKKITLIPRKIWLLVVILALFLVYFVVRNFVPWMAPVEMPI